MSSHKQIEVHLYDGPVLPEIDELLVELVLLLNRPGLWTTNCCQGDKERFPLDAYVSVDGPLAYRLAHALLDDQLDHGTMFIEGISIDKKPSESAITIRWFPGAFSMLLDRFKRVLASKAFTQCWERTSQPGVHND